VPFILYVPKQNQSRYFSSSVSIFFMALTECFPALPHDMGLEKARRLAEQTLETSPVCSKIGRHSPLRQLSANTI
jgi:hypothetical protein